MTMTIEKTTAKQNEALAKIDAQIADAEARKAAILATQAQAEKTIIDLSLSAQQKADQQAQAKKLAVLRYDLDAAMPALRAPFDAIRANVQARQAQVDAALRLLYSLNAMQAATVAETQSAMVGLNQALQPFAALLEADPSLYPEIRAMVSKGIDPNIRFTVRPDQHSAFVKIFGIHHAPKVRL